MTLYWRESLPLNERSVYDSIYQAIKNKQNEVTIPHTSDKRMLELYLMILDDHPELFYVHPSFGFANGFMKSQIFLSYYDNANNEQQVINYIDQVTIHLINNLKAVKDDYQKIVRILNFLSMKIDYEIDSDNNQNLATAMCNGKAQCSGYSRTFKYLADKLGIWCICVYGDYVNNNQRTPHEWNIVKVNQEYYHLDVTSACCSSKAHNKHVQNYQLLFNDDEIKARNYNWKFNTTPKCTKRLIVDINGSIRVNDESNIFNNFYDLRNFLKKSMENRETIISFLVNITTYSPEKITEMVKKEIEKTLASLKIRYTMKIQIQGQNYILNMMYS